MGQGITLDISARIMGYQDSLNRLKSAIDKLDPGSRLAKNLTQGLEAAQKRVQELGKNLTPRVTNDNQLDRLAEKINNTSATIELLGTKLQGVTQEDINFDSFGSEIRELEQQLADLEKQLMEETAAAFKSFIENSAELSDVLKKMQIDTKDKSIVQIFEEIAKKAEEAEKNANKAGEALNKAVKDYNEKETRLQTLEANPINNKEQIENNLRSITQSYSDAFQKMKEQISKGMTDKFGINKKDAEAAAAAFLGGLTPDTLRAHLDALVKIVKEKGKENTDLNEKNIFGGLFGGDFEKSWNRGNVDFKFFNNATTAWGQQTFAQIKDTFIKEYDNLSSVLTEEQKQSTLKLISEGNIQAALAQAIQDIESAYKKIQQRILTVKTQMLEAAGVRDNAQATYDEAKSQSDSYGSAAESTLAEITRLQSENSELRQIVEQQRAQIENKKNEYVKQIRSEGTKANESANELKLGANEANKYSEALEKVHQREQLVGKIEGIVQRWFSIYAAVRMVGNAIRSIISTIKELDKTITDITIVTNMSREDLWGQMPTYTKMAQDYAVSISGVYQVSQLFYQQGLQTNDVLTLTGETLKMARIAGLDYAEATNYKRKCYVA